MSNSIQLRVGDWSHDGHGHTDEIFVTTDKTFKEVSNTMAKLNKHLEKACGYSFDTVCENYEDNIIPVALVNALKDVGVNVGDYDKEDNGDMRTYSQDFMQLAVDALNAFSPELNLVCDEKIQPPVLDLGGYGLFWD